MANMLRPGHLGDMDQSFHTLLQFYERAVVRDTYHLALHAIANGILVFDILPRMIRKLLHTQGNTLPFFIVVEHLDFHGVTNRQGLRGVTYPSPGDVGNMEQPVETTQIDERTEICDVFNHTLAYLAHLQRLQNLLAQALALFFEHNTA